MQDCLADIGDFLTALRTSGVPVGPREIDRLRQLFERGPALDRNGLKTLLAALLVKTPAQRNTFEALFADWCPDHEADWPEPTPRETSRKDHQASSSSARSDLEDEEPEPTRRKPWWLWLGSIAAVILAVVLFRLGWLSEEIASVEVEKDLITFPTGDPVKTTMSTELPADPVKEVWYWRVEIDKDAITVSNRLDWPWLALLGLIALVPAVAVWWRYRRRFPEIKPQSPRRYLGFGWQPLPPPERDDSALVNPRERRQLVWQIERFVSDDPTRRLDLEETVDATARAGGFMELCFEPAVYDREIWFWLDRELTRSMPRMAAEQLLATLGKAGLRARRGFFTELPLRVDWPGQPGYRPEVQEGQGRQALVAILSDGEGLARRLGNLFYAGPTKRLLRSLRRWPRLCFVDCSVTGRRLQPLLAPYGLEAIALEQLPAWLGGVDALAQPASPLGSGLFGPDREWAAVLALGGAQADSDSAQSLRTELGLAVDPWQLDHVLAEAGQDRFRLINWLLRCEPLDDKGLPQAKSRAGRALTWWWTRYLDAEKQMQRQENPLLLWSDSLASRRWKVERSLLRLYREPEAATDELARLADDEMRDEIAERLAEFADDEIRENRSDDSHVYLTWRLDGLPTLTRRRLRWLGFAADVAGVRKPPSPDQYAPQLMLAMSALVALALSAFAAAAYKYYVPDPPQLVVQNPEVVQAVAVAPAVDLTPEQLQDGRYRVTVGSPRRTRSVVTRAGAEVPVSWRWGKDDGTGEDNAERISGSPSVVLRAGSLAQPIRACVKDWPMRSMVVIASSYDVDSTARQLAIRLLDRGSADQVLLGSDWAEKLGDWLGPSEALNRNTQLLIVLPGDGDVDGALKSVSAHPGLWAVTSSSDFAKLAGAIEFWEEGARSVDEIQELTVHDPHREVRIAGGPERQRDNVTGIEWVSVCPGTFTMSTSRTVTLSLFQIAATEATNSQYKTLRPKHEKDDAFPVVDVNWEQARSFCKDAGGDLPTEAQWEYAAHGGSRTRWSFGDDEERLRDYAWFYKNSSDQSHEVAGKLPNPLGLYDMHGNVWEWARDWYRRDYTSGFFVDPGGPNSGYFRVLRGGSFNDMPASLHSANRFDVRVLWDRRSGFRCVRVLPQP